MTKPAKRSSAETLGERAHLQEIDERYYLSQQLFSRRKSLGWSQERLAAHAGVTQPQLASLEAGQANPTLRTLVKLADALRCSLQDLFHALPDDLDGCTAADREGAETLQRAAIFKGFLRDPAGSFTMSVPVEESEITPSGHGRGGSHSALSHLCGAGAQKKEFEVSGTIGVELSDYTEGSVDGS